MSVLIVKVNSVVIPRNVIYIAHGFSFIVKLMCSQIVYILLYFWVVSIKKVAVSSCQANSITLHSCRLRSQQYLLLSFISLALRRTKFSVLVGAFIVEIQTSGRTPRSLYSMSRYTTSVSVPQDSKTMSSSNILNIAYIINSPSKRIFYDSVSNSRLSR